MKIRHDKWDDVDGVSATSKDLWEKRGAVYYRNHGWREVKPVRRDVTGEIEIQRPGTMTHFIHGNVVGIESIEFYHFEKSTMYDLPENWVQMWFPQGHAFSAWTWQFKRPCLIITKEE